jgi:hypothetical protein
MPLVMIKSDPRAREKPCIRCGYSLRKVTGATHCPECGLSVWLSLNQNDTLEVSNPDWLRRVALAVWVMAAANALMLASLVPVAGHLIQRMQAHQRFLEAMELAERYPDDPSKWGQGLLPPPRPDFTVLRSALLIGAAGFAAYHVGLFLLASNEGRYPDKLAGPRVGARVVCGFAVLVLLLVVPQVARTEPSPPVWFIRLVAVASAVLTWTFLRELARRVPHKGLRRTSGWLIVVPLVSLGYTFIRREDWPPDLIPVPYLALAAGVMVWFGLLLRRTAAVADRNWAAETATGAPAPA